MNTPKKRTFSWSAQAKKRMERHSMKGSAKMEFDVRMLWEERLREVVQRW